MSQTLLVWSQLVQNDQNVHFDHLISKLKASEAEKVGKVWFNQQCVYYPLRRSPDSLWHHRGRKPSDTRAAIMWSFDRKKKKAFIGCNVHETSEIQTNSRELRGTLQLKSGLQSGLTAAWKHKRVKLLEIIDGVTDKDLLNTWLTPVISNCFIVKPIKAFIKTPSLIRPKVWPQFTRLKIFTHWTRCCCWTEKKTFLSRSHFRRCVHADVCLPHTFRHLQDRSH